MVIPSQNKEDSFLNSHELRPLVSFDMLEGRPRPYYLEPPLRLLLYSLSLHPALQVLAQHSSAEADSQVNGSFHSSFTFSLHLICNLAAFHAFNWNNLQYWV